MRFGIYMKQLVMILLSSSLSLGLILAISILAHGQTTMNIDLTLEFDAIDGVWVMLALPALSILIFAALSPLSFFIHKLLSKRSATNLPKET